MLKIYLKFKYQNDEVSLSIGLTCTIGCDEDETVSNEVVTLTNASFLPPQVIEQISTDSQMQLLKVNLME